MNMRYYTLCLMMLSVGHTAYSMLAPILAGEAGSLAARGASGLVAAMPRADVVSCDNKRVVAYCEIFKRTQPLRSSWSLKMENLLRPIFGRGNSVHRISSSGPYFLPKPDTVYPEGTEYGQSGRQMPVDELPKGSWRVVRGWQDHGIQRGDYGHKVHVCKRYLKSSTGQDYEQVAKHVIDEVTLEGKPVNLNKRGFDYQLFCAGQEVSFDHNANGLQQEAPKLSAAGAACPYVQECFRYSSQDNPEKAKYSSLDDLIEAGKADECLVSLAIERDDMSALEKLLKAIGARREPSMSEDYVKKDSARQVHHYYGGRKKNQYNLLAEAMLSVHLGHTHYAPTPTKKLQSMLEYDTQDPRFKEAVEYLLKHGNLSVYMQLKGAQAIEDEQTVSDIHKKISSRLFAGLAVGAFVGGAKLAYDYIQEEFEKREKNV